MKLSTNTNNEQLIILQDIAKLALVKHLGIDGLHELMYPRDHETENASNADTTKLNLHHQLKNLYIPQVE